LILCHAPTEALIWKRKDCSLFVPVIKLAGHKKAEHALQRWNDWWRVFPKATLAT